MTLADWSSWQPADWPAPPGVVAGHTLRGGGVSRGPWGTPGGEVAVSDEGGRGEAADGGLNLGAACGDDPAAVGVNRARLAAHLPAEPLWLDQVHGVRVQAVEGPAVPGAVPPVADAAVTAQPGVVLAVLSADCLPVLLTNRQASVVAAVHAGWRGLAGGVIENAVAAARRLSPEATEWMAWLGPAIGPAAFEVGEDVLDAFERIDPGASVFFVPGAVAGKWQADLFGLARRRLTQAGVAQIHGGGICTVSNPRRLYSYRRDRTTGRLASLIWIRPTAA
jgi:YfiH family protein